MKTLSTIAQILGLIATLFCGIYLLNHYVGEPKEPVNVKRARIEIELMKKEHALFMEVTERQYQESIQSLSK